MIKKFIDKLLGKTPAAGKGALGKRVELAQPEHGIDRTLLDANAVRVVQTLKDAGYEAFVVGGAVRDLLLGLRPKDFDVATNATPEQVKALFRRAFIIGRRFRIVHVVFGRGREHEVIEVSTFRAMLAAGDAEQVSGNEKSSRAELAGKTHVVDTEGRVLRDNVWGPQIEDAARRDFTVNAMYYDPLSEVVVDYHHGVKDAKKRVLRMIGDPATRYREDPVRIVRAVRFAAKLGFEIEPKTRAPIGEMAALLENQPPSRLFDEMIKLLQTGHALRSIDELRKQGLIGKRQGVFPMLDAVLGEPRREERDRFVQLALADTDRRVGEDKPVAPAFLLACVLWHDVLEGWNKLKARGDAPFPALQQAVEEVFDARIGDISGRGKLGTDMREIWLMQPRFERRSGSAPYSLVEQPRFRAGFDFLRLRADAGEIDAELAEWWEDFSLGTGEERVALIELVREHSRGRRTAPRAHHAAPPEPAAALEGAAESAAPARRKRRRRRKPAAPAVKARRRAATRRDGRCGLRAVSGALPQQCRAWIGLGANLGDPAAALEAAFAALAAMPRSRLLARSSLYRSAPVDAAGPDYVNAVAQIETGLAARELLARLQEIERAHGRERSTRNAPRTLDLDLLLYGDEAIESPDLTVPHPRLAQRAFVLVPLAELAPGLAIPGLGAVSALLRAVADQRIEKLGSR